MIDDMGAVVGKMVAVVNNKEGSVTEVPWAMFAKFVGFLCDSIAHCFELKYLSWIFIRDFQVRIGGSARHEYKTLGSWSWQALLGVLETLEIMADFMPEVSLARGDLV